MNNNIISFEEYQKLLELQTAYEEGIASDDEMTLEQINNLIALYKSQIPKIENSIRQKVLIKRDGDNK